MESIKLSEQIQYILDFILILKLFDKEWLNNQPSKGFSHVRIIVQFIDLWKTERTFFIQEPSEG